MIRSRLGVLPDHFAGSWSSAAATSGAIVERGKRLSEGWALPGRSLRHVERAERFDLPVTAVAEAQMTKARPLGVARSIPEFGDQERNCFNLESTSTT